MKALILAGGRGSRLTELTKNNNKSMICLFEKPLLFYNLEHAIEAKVNEIIIVVGYKKEDIIKNIGYEYRGTKVSYVVQKEQRGVVNAIETAREAIGDADFILMLGDEVVVNARIREMIKKFKDECLFGVCGIVHENEKSSIAKTYSTMTDKEGRIFRLIEKPWNPVNNLKGTGHCVFKNEILSYIERTPISMKRGERELVDMIQEAIDDGKPVKAFAISKDYVNVNTPQDLELAREAIKKSQPKVLIVHTQMKFLGGAELLIIELANSLTKKGIKNNILALSKSKEAENKLINTEIIIPKHDIDLSPPGFKSTKDILKFIRVYRKKIRKISKEYDVINFHNFPTTWCLFPRKMPCVWMLNEPPNLWSKPDAGIGLKIMNKLRNRLDREIIRNSVDIICVADEFNKTRAEERYKKNPRIIYYGVNFEFFSLGNARRAIKKFNLEKKFVVTQSGMITPAKNQLESLKAIQKAKSKIANLVLVLAGAIADEKYKKELDEFIKKNDLKENVIFSGNLKREELRDLYKASDIGLFPVGEQGGWLAPFEMLCSANPVIVSEKMGASSIIKEFNLGIVSNDYSKALIEVYNNKEKYKKQAKDASKFIKNNFSWSVFSDKLINAYKDAIKMYS
ncbi:MAG: sugar phosphate nucleotidyltransferase [Candidatus Nanoarchaeia archaeon]